MSYDPNKTLIYHITDVANLPAILADDGLNSDEAMAKRQPNVVIGYDHIKLRRLKKLSCRAAGGVTLASSCHFIFAPVRRCFLP
jgi:hypothetical protein